MMIVLLQLRQPACLELAKSCLRSDNCSLIMMIVDTLQQPAIEMDQHALCWKVLASSVSSGVSCEQDHWIVLAGEIALKTFPASPLALQKCMLGFAFSLSASLSVTSATSSPKEVLNVTNNWREFILPIVQRASGESNVELAPHLLPVIGCTNDIVHSYLKVLET